MSAVPTSVSAKAAATTATTAAAANQLKPVQPMLNQFSGSHAPVASKAGGEDLKNSLEIYIADAIKNGAIEEGDSEVFAVRALLGIMKNDGRTIGAIEEWLDVIKVASGIKTHNARRFIIDRVADAVKSLIVSAASKQTIEPSTDKEVESLFSGMKLD